MTLVIIMSPHGSVNDLLIIILLPMGARTQQTGCCASLLTIASATQVSVHLQGQIQL